MPGHKQCADYAAIIEHCWYWQNLLRTFYSNERAICGLECVFPGLGMITLPAHCVEVDLLVSKTTAFEAGTHCCRFYKRSRQTLYVLHTGHIELLSQNHTVAFLQDFQKGWNLENPHGFHHYTIGILIFLSTYHLWQPMVFRRKGLLSLVQ